MYLFFTCITVVVFFFSCNDVQDFDMVYVEGGNMLLGTRDEYSDYDEKEDSARIKSFFISRYEVTQEQWISVMRFNPSKFIGNDRPVEMVCYEDVQLFLKRLNKRTGIKYRLPTEQEWEYAAKGGLLGNGFLYSGGNDIQRAGWTLKDGISETSKVGKKSPNELGLYDMTGNVHEWCDGIYEEKYYLQDSAMVKKYNYEHIRIIRGGGWDSAPRFCRNSNRSYHTKFLCSPALGFRLAQDVY